LIVTRVHAFEITCSVHATNLLYAFCALQPWHA
jgi:hypothetical protein